MPYIDKITLPTGTTYDLQDSGARTLIENLGGKAFKFIGATTSPLTDGATTNPITINNAQVTATQGDVVWSGAGEYVWDGTAWRLFGDTSEFGALAKKDSVTGSTSYKPAGTVSKPTFTGTKVTLSASYTPAGSVAISKASSGTANYTPAGTVSTPTITVTPNTTSVKPFGSAGTLPSFTATVSGTTLSLGWSAGTLPSAGTAVTVATGIKSATSTQPTFTGTGAKLDATFIGTAGTVSTEYTPAGTVSQPSFTGTSSTITITST